MFYLHLEFFFSASLELYLDEVIFFFSFPGCLPEPSSVKCVFGPACVTFVQLCCELRHVHVSPPAMADLVVFFPKSLEVEIFQNRDNLFDLLDIK